MYRYAVPTQCSIQCNGTDAPICNAMSIIYRQHLPGLTMRLFLLAWSRLGLESPSRVLPVDGMYAMKAWLIPPRWSIAGCRSELVAFLRKAERRLDIAPDDAYVDVVDHRGRGSADAPVRS
jgi:hypothetical protein